MNIPTIRHEPMSDIFHKYHIENFGFDAVLHEFLKAEPEDADAHDNPFDFTSFVISGTYVEKIWEKHPTGYWYSILVTRRGGECFYVEAETVHQIISVSNGGCKTLTLPGPATRKSGFWKFELSEVPCWYTGKFREWDQPEFE